MKVIICASKDYYESILLSVTRKFFNIDFIFVKNKECLTFDSLRELKPKYIFFAHWSYKIPKEIYNNFECIVFHMTDLPFGRGGSPLQNLISRGIYETKISALRCVEDFDAGPIYLKRPFSLYGNAEEIYLRSSKVIAEMIKIIIENDLMPIEQIGEVTIFNRRKPDESNVNHLQSLEKVFDYIRMLDAEGYPSAFLETETLTLEFSRAALKKDHIIADVKIMLKKDET